MGFDMPWVDTRKTDYGFEYSIGTIPIARAKWVRVEEKWKVRVVTLAPSDDGYASGQFDTETMPLNEVMRYIHARLEKPMPTPVID
jgi:hypothetical protein